MRRKSKKFQMRMTPLDHKSLQRLADEAGLTMAEWITQQIREAEARRQHAKE